MAQHDRIDPESLAPLEQLLEVFPGGFNGIPDIVARRAAVDQLLEAMTADLPPNDRVTHSDHHAPGPDGAPDVRLRAYRPADADGDLPGVYFIHGGGMVLGSIEGEELVAQMLCERVGAVVVSVDYRLAPEHPHPAPMDDCYAGLLWTVDNADQLGIDASRLAVYGGSAGGGLALAVALAARERGGPDIRFLMPIYPMVDDRNTTPSSHEVTDVGIWDRDGNIEAWKWYLGGAEPDAYAAPTRAEDLSGLPPTFIDVGEVDLFRDEDIALANRLLQAGVATELHVHPGAYHASETFAPESALSQRIWDLRVDALRRGLGLA